MTSSSAAPHQAGLESMVAFRRYEEAVNGSARLHASGLPAPVAASIAPNGTGVRADRVPRVLLPRAGLARGMAAGGGERTVAWQRSVFRRRHGEQRADMRAARYCAALAAGEALAAAPRPIHYVVELLH